MELSEEDSGSESFPVVFSGYQNQQVVLNGGKSLSSIEKFQGAIEPETLERFQLVVRDKIVEVDLPKAGINNYGKLHPLGYAIFDTDFKLRKYLLGRRIRPISRIS